MIIYKSYRWGCQHKNHAMENYISQAQCHHDSLSVSPAGFYIDVDKPFNCASPDGLVECSCCDKGLLEIKCPYCIKEKLPDEEFSGFYMSKHCDKWSLKEDHPFFYQVQTQLHVCRLSYCNFVIWSNDEIIVERIEANEIYFDSLISNVKDFFIYGILPEIIGKWYTRKPFVDPSGVTPMTGPEDGDIENDYDNEDYEKVWCYC